MDVAREVWRRRVILHRIATDADPTTPGYGAAFMRTYLSHYSTDPVTGRAIAPAEWHADFDAAWAGGNEQVAKNFMRVVYHLLKK